MSSCFFFGEINLLHRFFFFFSSRRRHTRFKCDWSSDVCSSDLLDLPHHGGIVGWLGYDVVREIERLPNVPAVDPGLPDAVMSLTGHVAAFDHFRQRIYLIENVLIRPGATEADVGAAYEAAAGRLDALVDDLARPLPYQPVAPPSDFAEGGELPVFRSSMAGGAYGRAVEVAREHILAGDIFQVVLAQRFDFDLGCDP